MEGEGSCSAAAVSTNLEQSKADLLWEALEGVDDLWVACQTL